MPKIQPKGQVTIQQVLAALLDDSTPIPPNYLHQFSDLEGVNLDALTAAWPQVSVDRRAELMKDLQQLLEDDTLVLFNSVARMAMKDSDARVRRTAVEMLREDDSPRLAPALMKILQSDPDSSVRAAAANTLGHFVLLGELEKVPEKTLRSVEDALIQVMKSQEVDLVRRRALESLGFSSRKEVKRLVRSAYESGENDWMVSALSAMGRSVDNVWGPQVMRSLRDTNPEIRIEAILAAGELQLSSARAPLLRMLDDENLDDDLFMVIISSLAMIGGEGVRDAIENLLDATEEERVIEFLEDALNTLSFSEDMDPFGMFDFEDQAMLEDETDSEADEDDPINQ